MVEIFGELAQKMPFALITSKDVSFIIFFKKKTLYLLWSIQTYPKKKKTVTIDDKKVFAREYSWGVVNATDERISDFYAVTLLVKLLLFIILSIILLTLISLIYF